MMADTDDETSVVQDVCGVTKERALELLEAGGSIERAVDIHLGTTANAATRNECPTTTTKRKKKQPAAQSPSKQAKLSSFFGGKTTAQASAAKASENTLAAAEAAAAEAKQQGEQATKPASGQSPQTASSKTKIKASVSDDMADPSLQYGALANTFKEMVATTKRNAKLDSLKNLLIGIVQALGGIGDTKDRTDDATVLRCALELILGSAGITLQVSGSAVSKAIREVTGVTSARLREAYRQTGDLGDAAERFVRNQRLLVEPKPLSIVAVHDVLRQIASQQGKGSQNQRHILIVKLLRSCKSTEMKFLVRTLLGNMRLGANTRTVLAALAMSIEELDASRQARPTGGDTTAASKAVQDTFDFCPRLDKMSLALLSGGISRMVETCVMEVHTPINPMLANPAHSLDEVAKLMASPAKAAVAEWKYDGVRCQAHYDGSSMKLFSRHMLETTDQFPDAIKAIVEAKNDITTSFILDSEIVGVERDGDGSVRLLPFQDLSTRRGDAQKDNAVCIRIFAFDLMYVNGESLAKKPLWERQRTLKEHFHETAVFCFAQSIHLTVYDEAALTDFLQLAVQGGAEGLMVKLTGEAGVMKESGGETKSTSDDALPCPYESGVRSQTWLKVKRDYVAGFADTIDVVPIGAWYGNGRKAQKNFLSPVLFAVYDEEEDIFRSISRCMSFTDAMYDAMRDFYFRGIPYPDGVGVVEDSQAKATNESDTREEQQVESGGEEAQVMSDAVRRNGEEWVNCYPSRPSAVVDTNESPPIWFKPMEVFEVSFADLTLSKSHTAATGLVDPTRGIALRFPRFKRRRPDKRPDQATTTVQIAELFTKQTKQGKS